jgi:hypothetical protein
MRRFHRSQATAQDACDLDLGKVVVVTQRQDGSLAKWQSTHCRPCFVEFRCGHHNALFRIEGTFDT